MSCQKFSDSLTELRLQGYSDDYISACPIVLAMDAETLRIRHCSLKDTERFNSVKSDPQMLKILKSPGKFRNILNHLNDNNLSDKNCLRHVEMSFGPVPYQK